MEKLRETPRTDAEEEESFALHNNSLSARAAGWAFARKLERELNELTRDKERLDWLEKSDYELYDSSTDLLFSESSREAIDEAMRETTKQ